MKRTKGLLCRHDYLFRPDLINGLSIRKIRGICVKCGKNTEITQEEYIEILKKRANKKDEL